MPIYDKFMEIYNESIGGDDALYLLFRMIYDNTCIDYVIGQHTIYREEMSGWGGHHSASNDDECRGYHECEKPYESEHVGDVHYVFEFGDHVTVDTYTLDTYAEDYNYTRLGPEDKIILLEGIQNLLTLIEKSIETNDLFYEGSLVLHNEAGFNGDHRGSDHCKIKLPFKDTIVLESPTFREFLTALYTLKSHKFDKWYELFTGVRKLSNRIIVNFDHGS